MLKKLIMIERTIKIVDVTLREWDQAPLTSFNAKEKQVIALMLSELWVDVIEVWFWASRVDFENIKKVSEIMKNRNTIISSLWRCVTWDTNASLESLKDVENPRIHIFLAMSKEHIIWKFQKENENIFTTRKKLIDLACNEIKRAKEWWIKNNKKIEIEFSPEDASWNSLINIDWKKYFSIENNEDFDFLVNVIKEVIKAWANVINLPDTLWNLLPHETYLFFKELKNKLTYLEKDYNFWLSCHIHNDLAISTANAIEAIRWWSKYVESTMLWIWERAWNTTTEQIIWIISEKWHNISREEKISLNPKLKTELIWPISDFIKSILWFDKSLQSPFIWKLSDSDWSGVHNANKDLYWWSKNKKKFGWIDMPEFFSPRWWSKQIIEILNNRGINLDKNSQILENITKRRAQESEITKALFESNIYRIYLEETWNFEIIKMGYGIDSLNIEFRIYWNKFSFYWTNENKNDLIDAFIEKINDFFWEKIIEIKNLSVKNKSNIYQEYEKFEYRTKNLLSDDFREKIKNIIWDWDRNIEKSWEYTISQIVLDIKWFEIHTISYDFDTKKSQLKAIIDCILIELIKKVL